MKTLFDKNVLTKDEKDRRDMVAHVEKAKKSAWKVQCIELSKIVKREREITETSLLEKSELSFWTFKKLRPQFLQMFPHIIYNKKNKIFIWIDNDSLSFFPTPNLYLYPQEK